MPIRVHFKRDLAPVDLPELWGNKADVEDTADLGGPQFLFEQNVQEDPYSIAEDLVADCPAADGIRCLLRKIVERVEWIDE